MPRKPTEVTLKEKEKQMEAGVYLAPGAAPTEQTEARILVISDMLASGKSEMKVRKFLSTEYGLKDPRSLDYYMAAAYRVLLPKDWNEEKERLCAKNLKTLQTIIDKCLDKENYKVAREAIDSMNKMLGITGQNAVILNKDNNGNEQIVISFD